MSPEPEWIGPFTAEDRAGLDALRQGQMAAIQAGDASAYAELCAEDILLMLQGRDPILGRSAFVETETRLFAQVRFTSIRQIPLRIERSGDLAFEAGRQEIATADPDKSSGDYLARRKYLHVLRRTGVGWRFAVLMSSNSE